MRTRLVATNVSWVIHSLWSCLGMESSRLKQSILMFRAYIIKERRDSCRHLPEYCRHGKIKEERRLCTLVKTGCAVEGMHMKQVVAILHFLGNFQLVSYYGTQAH